MSCSAAARTCSGLSRTASRPGVELRVQRLDAAVHDLGEAGEVVDRADLEAGARRAPRAVPPVETSSTPSSARPRAKSTIPRLSETDSSARRIRTAPGSVERLPRRGGGVLGDAAEHRGGARVRAPSRGNTGRYAAKSATGERGHGAAHDDRPRARARAHAATSSRSASTTSTTTSTRPRRRREARREEHGPDRGRRRATARTTTTAARTPAGFDDPEADEDEDDGGLGAAARRRRAPAAGGRVAAHAARPRSARPPRAAARARAGAGAAWTAAGSRRVGQLDRALQDRSARCRRPRRRSGRSRRRPSPRSSSACSIARTPGEGGQQRRVDVDDRGRGSARGSRASRIAM